MGPHGCSDDSQGRDCSLRINVGHPEGPWDNRPHGSNHGVEVGLPSSQDTNNQELRRRQSQECDLLDHYVCHHDDVHLSWLSHLGDSPSSGHQVSDLEAGFPHMDFSVKDSNFT